MLEDGERQELRVKVPFFRRWLETEGIYRLPPRGISEQVGQALEAEEARLRVSAAEVRRLVAQWERFEFRGQQISRDRIETWLVQFETPVERRVAFRLLERLKVITDGEIHSGFRRLHRLAVQQSRDTKLRRGHMLTNFFVAGLGEPGSSGESFSYSYRQANNIPVRNVVALESLVDRLASRHDVNTVVIIDDFIGSGGTAIDALRPLAQRSRELANEQLSNVVDSAMKNDQAATLSSVVVSSSVTLIPSLNVTPSSTSLTSSWPLNRRQRSWAASKSL